MHKGDKKKGGLEYVNTQEGDKYDADSGTWKRQEDKVKTFQDSVCVKMTHLVNGLNS